MNEDELRAFLDSATVGDDKSEGAEGGASEATGSADQASADEAATDHASVPTQPMDVVPGAAEPKPAAERGPSFEELMGIRRREAAGAAPTGRDAAAEGGGSEPELTPIVLPGPPASPRPQPPVRAAAASAPRPPAPQPAQSPSPLPEPVPPLASPAPASSPTSPLPLGLDPLPEPPEGGDYERIAVTGAERSRSRLVPWIVVGAGAVVAIVASILIVLAVRGGEESPPVTEPPTTQSPSEPTEPSEEPTSPPPTESEPPADEAPEVEVGTTGDIKIPNWEVAGQISAKFGWPSYTIDANDNLILEGGTLLPQFPESCEAMRTGFGITKKADGSFEVFRPAQTCAEAPDLYDQVWGLTAAIIPTLKPL